MKKPKTYALPELTGDNLDELDFGVYIINKTGIIEFANTKFLEISGVKKREDVVGQNIYNISTYKKYGLIDLIRKGFSGEVVRSEGIEYTSSVGKKKSIRTYRGIAMKDSKGKVDKLLCIIEDISEKRKNELTIKKNLKEKKLLLRELHHRVKNNMQIIVSLLHLNSLKIKGPEAESFLEIENQINSMILVHENLYGSNDLSSINFSAFINELADNLLSGFPGKEIKTIISTEKTKLGIRRAIPCGLIINELITNSLKYAFTKENRGTIEISFVEDNNSYNLKYKDSGPGFDIDKIEKDSFGIVLIRTLVKQLNGRLEISSDRGAEYNIIFS